jgi:hypothetical protein
VHIPDSIRTHPGSVRRKEIERNEMLLSTARPLPPFALGLMVSQRNMGLMLAATEADRGADCACRPRTGGK